MANESWVDDALLRRAVSRLLVGEQRQYVPPFGAFLEYLRAAKVELDRAAASSRPTLAGPPWHEAAVIDPHDPWSCTPQERERWAQEDVWLRQWAGRLKPTAPEQLARLSAADRERVLDIEQRNASVAGWPDLTPAQRRAKEQRIEQERRRATAALRARFGHPDVPAEPRPAEREGGAADAVSPDDEHFAGMGDKERALLKHRLDVLHLAKIDLADEVLILNVGGYIGDSTRRELEYAAMRAKPIRWWDESRRPASDGPWPYLDAASAVAQP